MKKVVQIIITISGMPGSGKSTLAKEIAEKLEAVSGSLETEIKKHAELNAQIRASQKNKMENLAKKERIFKII